MSLRQLSMLVILFLLTPLACSRMAKEFPSYAVDTESASDQLRAAEDAYRLASQAKTRGDQMGLAKKGMHYATRCQELAPKQAACYFYQALNTGLYYEAKVLGYPTAMVRIANAAEQVIALEPSYKDGGGYRILGQLFLKAPAFNLGNNEVTRNLEKSKSYLEQAVALVPDYPENHLFLAETLVAMEEWEKARKHLEVAREQVAKQTYPDKDVREWEELIRELDGKVAKHDLPL